MIPILGTFLTLFVGGHPVHFWVINSYNWQLFGNYHFSDQFVLKITPYKRDLGVKVDIFDPQLELKIHFWVKKSCVSVLVPGTRTVQFETSGDSVATQY